MSRASTPTLLSLDRWAAIIGLNPWYFNQATTTTYPGTDCEGVTFQYDWIAADQIGREDIARAIAQAEEDIARESGYWPAPRYVMDDELPYPRHHDRGLFNVNMRQARGDRKSVTLSWAKLQALGIEARALMAAASGVTYAGNTATVSFATTLTDPNEVHIYFRVGDGADAAGSEQYRIRPVKVSFAGGMVTITGNKWLFLKPSLWEGNTAIDGDDITNFVLTVDIYRHYCDPSDIGVLIWDPLSGCTGDGCVETEQTICASARDWDASRVLPWPATWDATACAYSGECCPVLCTDPDKVRFNYLAGHPLGKDGEMDDYWARAVAYYAAALLDRPLCSCEAVAAKVEKWREDLALNLGTSGGSRSYQLSDTIINSPFGTTRGAVFAWERVRRQTQGRALAV